MQSQSSTDPPPQTSLSPSNSTSLALHFAPSSASTPASISSSNANAKAINFNTTNTAADADADVDADAALSNGTQATLSATLSQSPTNTAETKSSVNDNNEGAITAPVNPSLKLSIQTTPSNATIHNATGTNPPHKQRTTSLRTPTSPATPTSRSSIHSKARTTTVVVRRNTAQREMIQAALMMSKKKDSSSRTRVVHRKRSLTLSNGGYNGVGSGGEEGRGEGKFKFLDVEGEHDNNGNGNGNNSNGNAGTGTGTVNGKVIPVHAHSINPHRSKTTSKTNINNASKQKQQQTLGAAWRKPSSTLRITTETLTFLLYTSNSFLIPIRILIGSREQRESSAITITASLVQFTFFLDFLMRACVWAVEVNGNIIFAPAFLYKSYKSDWMLYDFVGFFPFYYTAHQLGVPDKYGVLLLMLQMVKLMRFPSYFKFLDLHLTRRQINMNASKGFIEVSKVMILVVITMVIFGCILVHVGCPDYILDSDDDSTGVCVFTDPSTVSTVSWMQNVNLSSSLGSSLTSSIVTQLSTAVYIVAQALYTVGYGDIPTSNTNGERIFTTFMMLCGSFAYAYTIAVMSSVIANNDMLYMEYRSQIERVKHYMETRAFDSTFKDRVTNHFGYLFNVQFGKSEVEILNEIPVSLRTEVRKINVQLLKGQAFCAHVSDGYLLKEIANNLVPLTYSPNEIVVLRDSCIRSMFFIRQGRVNILDVNESTVIDSLITGDNFGGIEFFIGTLFEYTMQTSTFSEILVLEKETYDSVICPNPRFDEECGLIESSVEEIKERLHENMMCKHHPSFGTNIGTTIGGTTNIGTNIGTNVNININGRSKLIVSNTNASNNNASYQNQNNGENIDEEDKEEDNDNDIIPPSYLQTLLAKQNEIKASPNKSQYFGGDSTHNGVVLLFLEWRARRIKNQDMIMKTKNNLTKNKRVAAMTSEITDSTADAYAYNNHSSVFVFVVRANSRVRVAWDALALLCTLWTLFAIPYRLYVTKMSNNSASILNDERGFALPVDYACDVFFILSIYLNLRVFAFTEVNEKGKLVHITETSKIQHRYVQTGRIPLEVLTSLPFDILGLFFGKWNILRVPKLLAAVRLPTLVTDIKDHLERYHVHVSIDAALSIDLFLFSIIFIHWVSCGYVIIGEGAETTHLGEKFTASIYFCLVTMTTVGLGDIAPMSSEGRWFSTVLMIFGSCFTAGIIANITSMAHKVVVSEDNAQHVTTCVEKYMLEKDLPANIRERCLRYFRMLHASANESESKILAKLIPKSFHPAIANYNYSALLASCPIFSLGEVTICRGFLHSVAMLLREEIVVEGDWVTKDDPSHDQWYHIKDGTVHLKDKDTLELMQVCKVSGSGVRCFGEYSLFFPQRKCLHAIAVSNCVLISLDPDKFNLLEDMYASEFEIMRDFVWALCEEGDRAVPLHVASMGNRELGDEECEEDERRSSGFMAEVMMADDVFATTTGRETAVGGGTAGSRNGTGISGISGLGSVNGSTKQTHQLLAQTLFAQIRSGKGTLHPDYGFQLTWNIFVLLFSIYNVFAIPFRCAFMGTSSSLDYSFFIDYFGDLVFVGDMWFRTNMFAYTEGEKIIKDRVKIKAHYRGIGLLSGRSFYDILAVIPFELLAFVLLIPKFNVVQTFSAFRSLRLYRMVWLKEHIRCFDTLYLDFTSNNYKNQLKIFKLLTGIFMFVHWVGCMFYLMAYIQNDMEGRSWGDCYSVSTVNHMFSCVEFEDGVFEPLWSAVGSSAGSASASAVNGNGNAGTVIEQKPIVSRYVRSVYWSTTVLTTAGFGDVSATTVSEQLFSILCLITGTLLFANVISNLEEIVAQVDVTSTLFQTRVDEVKAFMSMRGISDTLQDYVLVYYDTLWVKQKGATEDAILSYLPPRIRSEVLKYHVMKVLKTAPIFECFTESFMNDILSALQSGFYMAKDSIYEKGQCPFELYIITSGAVSMMDGKTKLMTVGAGALLGEGEFFNHEVRVCKAIAAEFTNVFLILQDDFQRLLALNPEMQEVYNVQLAEASDRIDTSAKIEKMKKNLKSGGKMATMLMLDSNIFEKKELMFLPDHPYRRRWDFLCLCAILVNIWSVPLRVAFMGQDGYDASQELVFLFLNLFLDCIFWCDMYFNFSLFAVVKNGLLITDKEDFKQLYKHGAFKYDLLASLPFDSICTLLGLTNIRTKAIIRLARFIHLLRLPGLMQSMIDNLEEKGVRLKAEIWHCFRMITFVLLVTHWYACIFYYIAIRAGLDSSTSWTAGTALEDEGLPLLNRYTTSLYWSVYSVTLVGYGDINLRSNVEMIFSILCMFTGSVFCDAGITAILSSLVGSIDASAGEANAWMQVITKYVKHRGLPVALQHQIFGYFVHLHLSEHDIEELVALDNQPRVIRQKLLVDVCFEGMRLFPTLIPYADGFVKSVCHCMVPYLALPQEILITANEACDKIYLIVRGNAQVLERIGGPPVRRMSEELSLSPRSPPMSPPMSPPRSPRLVMREELVVKETEVSAVIDVSVRSDSKTHLGGGRDDESNGSNTTFLQPSPTQASGSLGTKMGSSGKINIGNSPISNPVNPRYRITTTLSNGSIIGDFKPNDFTYRTLEYTECYVLSLDLYVSCFSAVKNNRKNSQRDLSGANSGGLRSSDARGFIVSGREGKRKSVGFVGKVGEMLFGKWKGGKALSEVTPM